jgi:hypothetical protein
MEYLRNPTPARDLEPYIEEFRQMVGKMLYPGILSTKAFGAIIINLCHEELGIEKAQGLRIYQLVALALCYAFSELLEDDDMTFALPDHIEEMAKLGPEAYLEKLADSQ